MTINIKTTKEQDLAIGEDIYNVYQEGQSFNQSFAIGMLQHLLEQHKIFDTEGNPIEVSLDTLPKFGIHGHSSTFVSDLGKEKPIFCIIKTVIALNSPDWSIRD